MFSKSLKVHKIMTELAEGKSIEPPRVSPINGFYYVLNGNHRIMAMKQIGHTHVACKIHAHKSSRNVANFDENDCCQQIERGYAGFEKVILGTKEMKERAYKEEERLSDLLESILENNQHLAGVTHSSVR